ncbi:MAG TPA: FAD-dependent oxidoreductase [Steroidobacteraceae bacterium]|jgi:2-polyprenyl-6-methoxyphenol hydroxylase-like FAD-dependent oxidoreductase|nr:FAD-dependent oxidoreductase [Steroidobacteraceae bacterium]
MGPTHEVQCCIVGGGPAGMLLGYLLGRAGVKTLLLEKHADFLRDFRGDTVHPSTLRIMEELGLLDDFLSLPHSKIRSLSAEVDGHVLHLADFGKIAGRCNFVALMPQWDFLNFLASKAQRYPTLHVAMSCQATSLIEDPATGDVIGVNATGSAGPLQIRADLVVGCDGRSSTVRACAGLPVEILGSPIDVLWFRLSKKQTDRVDILGHLGHSRMLVTIDRGDYWQCATVIAKGGIDRVRAAGIEAFRGSIAQSAHFLSDRVHELKSFDDVKLLSVMVDRLTDWSQPGVLCIGDAAHAMSPVGGVGINLAIQDAVATANLLAAKLRAGTVRSVDLERVRRRRLWPVRVIQRLQVTIHNQVLNPVISSAPRVLSVPLPLRLVDRFPGLRGWPAQLLGVGVRPEHVHSPRERAGATHG